LLLLRNARVPLACLPPGLATPAPETDVHFEPWRLVDIAVDDDRIVSVHETTHSIPPTPLAGKFLDLAGSLVFPGLIDVHTHLDKVHTWDRAPNPTGEFADALKILQADSASWTAEDMYRRANFALRRAWAHGTVAMRTHIDTSATLGEVGHDIMQRLRTEWAGRIELQTVSLCNPADFCSASTAKAAVDLTTRFNANALGGFPQPGPDLPRHVDALLAMARELGLGLDLHVDESGLAQAECLRVIAQAVPRHEFPHPVTCGHCCSLSLHTPERQRETITLIKAAGLHIVSLPLCNLYLQGRLRAAPAAGEPRGMPCTPQWRGLTLLHELMDAGITVACASDNVRDAFYAYGDLDVMEVYVQSVRLGHLDTRLSGSPAIVTTAPARIMGLTDAGRIARGARADLLIFEARTFNELLSLPGAPRRLLRGEFFREPDYPAYAELAAPR
jgi:cytosine/creatinine deaminase